MKYLAQSSDNVRFVQVSNYFPWCLTLESAFVNIGWHKGLLQLRLPTSKLISQRETTYDKVLSQNAFKI